MGEFFKGWQRKIGCVTLVMALASMAGWVRSFQIADYIQFVGLRAFNRASMYEGYITWCRDYDFNEEDPRNLRSEWESERIQGLMVDYPVTAHALTLLHNRDIGFRVNRLGFGFGTMIDDGGHVEQRVAVLPFWAIVIPLTLFSAYLLLLSNPRVAKPKNAVEPTTAEGA